MSAGESGGTKGAKAPNLYPMNLTGFEGSIQLIIHKLNGKKYLESAQSIELVIDGIGCLGYLTGEIS